VHQSWLVRCIGVAGRARQRRRQSLQRMSPSCGVIQFYDANGGAQIAPVDAVAPFFYRTVSHSSSLALSAVTSAVSALCPCAASYLPAVRIIPIVHSSRCHSSRTSEFSACNVIRITALARQTHWPYGSGKAGMAGLMDVGSAAAVIRALALF